MGGGGGGGGRGPQEATCRSDPVSETDGMFANRTSLVDWPQQVRSKWSGTRTFPYGARAGGGMDRLPPHSQGQALKFSCGLKVVDKASPAILLTVA